MLRRHRSQKQRHPLKMHDANTLSPKFSKITVSSRKKNDPANRVTEPTAVTPVLNGKFLNESKKNEETAGNAKTDNETSPSQQSRNIFGWFPMVTDPSIDKFSVTRKESQDPPISFWPSLPVDPMNDQYIRLIYGSDGSRLILRADNEVVGFVERKKSDPSSPHNQSMKGFTSTIWGDQTRSVSIGIVNEVATEDNTVPTNLLRLCRHYRMYSNNPRYPGHRRTRHLSSIDDAGEPLQHPSRNIEIHYHCGDITSQPSGFFGNLQKHDMRFHLAKPKCWANYSIPRDGRNDNPPSTTIVRNERTECAEMRAQTKSSTELSTEQEIRVSPGFDPMVISIFLAITAVS